MYYKPKVERIKEIDEWLERYRAIWLARHEQPGKFLEFMKTEDSKG